MNIGHQVQYNPSANHLVVGLYAGELNIDRKYLSVGGQSIDLYFKPKGLYFFSQDDEKYEQYNELQ